MNWLFNLLQDDYVKIIYCKVIQGISIELRTWQRYSTAAKTVQHSNILAYLPIGYHHLKQWRKNMTPIASRLTWTKQKKTVCWNWSGQEINQHVLMGRIGTQRTGSLPFFLTPLFQQKIAAFLCALLHVAKSEAEQALLPVPEDLSETYRTSRNRSWVMWISRPKLRCECTEQKTIQTKILF